MIIYSENDMLALAALMARLVDPPLVIYLSGPLGAGKTTFSRGFIQALGYQGSVKSPTYTLVESYEFSRFHVFHFDLYRIHDPEELELMGIREYFHAQAIDLIEWPEQGNGRIPACDIKCCFTLLKDQRQIKFIANSRVGEQIVIKLLAQLKVVD